MRAQSKRLDVCLGDFAVSIQGYDEPLAVLEEVLRIGQRVAAESPDLLNSQSIFDEATMSEIIESVAARAGIDPDALGAVPGLVLVHRQDETDGGIDGLGRRAPAMAGWTEDGEDTGADEGGADAVDALRRRFEERRRADAGDADPAGASDAAADAPAAGPLPDAGRRAATLRLGSASEAGEPEEERVVNIFAPPAATGPGAAEAPPTGRRPLFAPRSAPAAAGDGDGTESDGADGAAAKPAGVPAPPRRPAGAEGVGLGDRFESLLAKVHGRTAETEAAPKPTPAATAVATARMSPAEVAAAAGAEDAQDALLSAAAFLTVIRRQPRFTRRDLMAVLDEIPGEFPRTLEIQIKGIGKLTRNGSLRRLDDDHFGLSRELTEKFGDILKS